MSHSQERTIATAPGKIILFGEHAVVYGRPALAVPVSQVKAVCQIDAARPGQGLEVIAQDLGQRFDLDRLDRLDQFDQTPVDNPLAVAICKTFSHLGITTMPDLCLRVRSTIPIARGLGSGAAISTAIVKALSIHLQRPLEPPAISDIVFEVEKIHHGTPSGIDNTVVAFGQPIFFQKGKPIIRLNVQKPLCFVIADTGIESPTHKVVGDLRMRRAGDVERYEAYFDDMAALALEARAAIEGGRLAAVGKCMIENHAILAEIGISSPALNRLVEAALKAQALGAKLSGAGWGGNMIALVQPSQAELVAQALRAAGAVYTTITEIKN